MDHVKNYIDQHHDRFLEELMALLRIPSISLRSENKPDMHNAAVFVKEKLVAAGADKAEIITTEGHPIVYGEKILDRDLPTVLVYGHYDVQPPDPLELWDSPPFEPVVKDGKIYARGASDNKGQIYMHIKAFELLVKTSSVPCNIKFMIEGEEEIGSPSLESFCKLHREKLACDVILVSDTTMVAEDTPAITIGLRGLSYLEVSVTGPNRDLHSGLYGGAVANPANVLAKMLAQLIDEHNHITIPGFYDEVLELTDEERNELNRIPFSREDFKSSIGIADEFGEKGYSTPERIGIRPSFDINGIWGGYTGEGAKTVLPAKAHAKVSMRLVPHQNADEVAALFEAYFMGLAPNGVTVSVKKYHGGAPYLAPTDTVGYVAASNAMQQVFSKQPVPLRSGGTIPIIPLFEEILGVKTILMGFGLDSDAIHSPNEHFSIKCFFKGIETIVCFYESYTALQKKES